jgi:hypothetical protein
VRPPLFCHSERSEESAFLVSRGKKQIPRSARNDKKEHGPKKERSE